MTMKSSRYSSTVIVISLVEQFVDSNTFLMFVGAMSRKGELICRM